MVMIDWLYVLFAACALLAATRMRKGDPRHAQRAATMLYIGALALLPAAAYRDIGPGGVDVTKTIPVWFVGVLIPTPFLIVNKGWIAPLVALICGAILDRDRLARFKPRLVDAPILIFCCLPIVQRIAGISDPNPSTVTSTLLLWGCWALPWFVGRLYLNDRNGRTSLIDGLILFSLLLVPIAILEGISKIRVHELLYGTHPFAHVGIERYVGYRPLAFFEDGNQYGIWICCAALAAWWRARFHGSPRFPIGRILVALTLLSTAIASQSAGAIALMIAFIAWLEFARFLEINNWLYKVSLLVAAAAVGLLLTGKLTLSSFGLTPERMAAVADYLRGLQRSSLQWRIGRILDNLPGILEHLALGKGQWNWTSIFRPWDLPMMLIGMFGLTGLALITLSFIGAVYRRRWQRPARKGSTRYLFLALIGMATADAFMNTYVFLPALAMLGGLAPTPRPKGREARRQHDYFGAAEDAGEAAPVGRALAAGGEKPV